VVSVLLSAGAMVDARGEVSSMMKMFEDECDISVE
jgi:hypothetical protein